MTKTGTIKLSDDEIIELFCDAVRRSGEKDAAAPKLTLFIGNRMFGKRFYANSRAARQAVMKLAPSFVMSLTGQHPNTTVRAVQKAVKSKSRLRKLAVDAAFTRELLYAQPVVRNPPPAIASLRLPTPPSSPGA